MLGSVLRTDSNKVEKGGKKGQVRYLCGLSMAEVEDTGTEHVADLAYVLNNNKESFYDPELVTSKVGEPVKSKLAKSKLAKSEIGKSELVKSRLVMSGEKEHPAATPSTGTSIHPSPAATSEAVNGQA